MAWLKGVFDLLSGKAWSILIAVGGVLAGAITLFAAGRKSGKDAIEAKQAKQAAKVRKKAHTVALEGERRYDKARKKPFYPYRIDAFEN